RIVLDDVRLAPDLHALPGAVVDQEEKPLGVLAEIALGDVLPVAGEIGKADRPVVEHLEKSRGSAAVLNVGLAALVRGAQEDARLALDERGEIETDTGRP